DARPSSARRGRLVLANGHALLPRLEDLDGVSLGERDDRPLLVGPLALREPAPLDLAAAVERVDREDADVPDLLDRLLDLGLVGVPVDEERVHVPLQAGVRLLRDDGADDDVAGGLHARASSSSPSDRTASAAPSARRPSRTSSAACVNSTRSAARTS